MPIVEPPGREKAAPIFSEDRRHQIEAAGGVVSHVRLQIVEYGLGILAGDVGQVAEPLPQQFEFVGRLGHECEDVLVVALHRRGKPAVRGYIPAKVWPSLNRKSAPVGMAKFVHHADGRSLADPGPFVEPIAAEETGVALHLAQVQAAQ